MAQSNHHRPSRPATDCRRCPEHPRCRGARHPGLAQYPLQCRGVGSTRLLASAADGEPRLSTGRTCTGQARP